MLLPDMLGLLQTLNDPSGVSCFVPKINPRHEGECNVCMHNTMLICIQRLATMNCRDWKMPLEN